MTRDVFHPSRLIHVSFLNGQETAPRSLPSVSYSTASSFFPIVTWSGHFLRLNCLQTLMHDAVGGAGWGYRHNMKFNSAFILGSLHLTQKVAKWQHGNTLYSFFPLPSPVPLLLLLLQPACSSPFYILPALTRPRRRLPRLVASLLTVTVPLRVRVLRSLSFRPSFLPAFS